MISPHNAGFVCMDRVVPACVCVPCFGVWLLTSDGSEPSNWAMGVSCIEWSSLISLNTKKGDRLCPFVALSVWH